MNINEKILADLGYLEIKNELIERCASDSAKEKVAQLKPSKEYSVVVCELKQTKEYLNSFLEEEPFPKIEFKNISRELKRLEIENYYLEAEVCVEIKQIAVQNNFLLKFTKKHQELYPEITQFCAEVEYTEVPIKLINKVFNKFGEIKDDASPNLHKVRKQIQSENQAIGGLFNKLASSYRKAGFLDDITESILDNKQVLAVKSAYRKRVKGSLIGASKTGSISFIEPQELIESNRKIHRLKDDEKQEVILVLRALTAEIAIYQPLFEQYLELLTHFDFLRAKARLAQDLQACLPELSQELNLNWYAAYHPILFLKNKVTDEKTIPQDIFLNKQQRFVIISGPNAGGKSITLKTVGLLQLMLQSGLLIPVHPESKACFFDKIFTDIGDNQSIENHLSTYSYRLKTMRKFLQSANEKSLLLIDEFGTGSDPELGGALAEVFMEELYQKKSFGIFTTHYTNLKLLAEDLPEATNASMLFNEHNLKPLYKLEIGQAGSSFTFEVATKNGIPYSIINKAKKKIEGSKVRLDKTIVKLQQQKSKIEFSKRSLDQKNENVDQIKEEVSTLKKKLQSRLESYHTLYNKEAKLLNLGKKFKQIAEQYAKTNQKKQLVKNTMKLVQIENAEKTPKLTKTEVKVAKIKEQEIKREIQKKMPQINKVVEKDLTQEKLKRQKEIDAFKVGDRVKIKDSSSVGTIQKIERKKAFINYGSFTTQIKLEELYKV